MKYTEAFIYGLVGLNIVQFIVYNYFILTLVR